ncbi:hypothetical protein NDU88_001069 [Pleurodeles waltl]|uniref:Uncharacterized protein n=1 Tax=Pleurodeles waltl TaxID=8319 RepID=A0AAV7VAQ6_PLEWA|nr:hypothetical protein NDU88_001067 [Pleurodeles waltl]KAJ1197207.1 hypothetical protein NDU88_001069 [Pleurodeles waltl]
MRNPQLRARNLFMSVPQDDRTHASFTRMRDPRLLGQTGFSTHFRGVRALGPLCCRARCPRAAGLAQESCGLSLSQKCR